MGSLLTLVVCLALLLFLGTIIRFSFIGGARAKGSQKRLHRPELSEIESKWGVTLPESSQKYYQSEIVARSDFYRAPAGTNPIGLVVYRGLFAADLPRCFGVDCRH